MKKKRIAILGASGYTGGELLRFLLVHPQVEVTYITAERRSGKNIADVFPNLTGLIDLELQPLEPELIPGDIDIVFCALPHGKSAPIVKGLFERDVPVIDLGADFRLSHERYRRWYGVHPCPELLSEAVYGLTEINRQEISRARIVANPGCYP
jgi:N-acetyl-gamma-glutamyl-phosphate reductase